MRTTLTTFQLVLIGAAILFLVVGILIFAGILPGFRAPQGGMGGEVVWWGTIPTQEVQQSLSTFQSAHKKEFTLVYVEKDPRTLEGDLVNTLAVGEGPDLVSLSHEVLARQRDKIFPIPYEFFSRRLFLDTFVRAGEIFLANDGVLGLPFSLDPLVLYYNEDLLTSAKIARPPANWNELQGMNSMLTKLNDDKRITQSAIALGQTNNIAHAKDILSLLIMQAGNPITARQSDGNFTPVLKNSFGLNRLPAAEAVAFYNRFSDPQNLLYSWNGSRPEARDAFVRSELVFYLGYASEADLIQRQNPQLNFDVAFVPQRPNSASLTYARLSNIAVTKKSQNKNTAITVAYLLTGGDFAKQFSELVFLPPARKDLLQHGHEDPLMDVFYSSAITSQIWFDPAAEGTGEIFREMAENARSGRLLPEEAVGLANDKLLVLFEGK